MDKKITELVEASSIDATTFVPIVKTINGTPTNYKYKLTNTIGSDPLKANILNPTFNEGLIVDLTNGDADSFKIDGLSATILKIDGDTYTTTITGTTILPSTTTIGTISGTELSMLDGITSSIQTQLDGKATILSQAFTGTPSLPTGTTAVTQVTGNSSTKLATTAFVQQENTLKEDIVKSIEPVADGYNGQPPVSVDCLICDDYISLILPVTATGKELTVIFPIGCHVGGSGQDGIFTNSNITINGASYNNAALIGATYPANSVFKFLKTSTTNFQLISYYHPI